MTETVSLSHPEAILPPKWYEVWIHALTRPRVDTFKDFLARDTEIRVGRAVKWVFVAGFIWTLINEIYGFFVGKPSGFFGVVVGIDWPPALTIFGDLLVSPPVGVFSYLVISWIYDSVAGLLGGVRNLDQFAYLSTAIYSPYLIVSVLLDIVLPGAVPYFSFYRYLLYIILIRAAYDFSWARSVFLLISPLLIFSFFACALTAAISIVDAF